MPLPHPFCRLSAPAPNNPVRSVLPICRVHFHIKVMQTAACRSASFPCCRCFRCPCLCFRHCYCHSIRCLRLYFRHCYRHSIRCLRCFHCLRRCFPVFLRLRCRSASDCHKTHSALHSFSSHWKVHTPQDGKSHLQRSPADHCSPQV